MSTIDTGSNGSSPVYTWNRTMRHEEGADRPARQASDQINLTAEQQRQLEESMRQAAGKEDERDVVELDTKPLLFKKSAEVDVEAIKATLERAKQSQQEVDTRIRDVLSRKGIKIASGERMKIGVGSNGRIAVDMDDKEKAREIEKILNGEKGLASEIKESQRIRGEAAKAIQDAIPSYMSVDGLVKLMRDGPTERHAVPPEMTSEDYQNLQFISLFAENPDVLETFNELYSSAGIETGRENNWLAAPQDALATMGRNGMAGIADAVRDYNLSMREMYGNDPEELEARLVSLRDVSIYMDGDGNIKIEGSFGKGKEAERAGKGIVEGILEEVFEADKNEFGESKFKQVARRLVEDHDEQFGDVGKHHHTGMIRIRNGRANAYVSSPEAEAELTGEIQDEVNQMLKDEGVKLEYELQIAVDEKGNIKAVNPPADEMQAKEIESLLDTLTRITKVEGNKAISENREPTLEEGLQGAAQRIAPKLRHLATHRAEGDGWFVRSDSADKQVDEYA